MGVQRGSGEAPDGPPATGDGRGLRGELLLERIRTCPPLPSLPAVAVDVLALIREGKFNMQQLAAVISRDPALAAKILSTANSSLYGRPHAVSTLRAALVLLGERTAKTLALSYSVVGALAASRGGGFDRMGYWRRSLYAATAARGLAAAAGVSQVDGCFLAALLMDIGVLALEGVLGPRYAAEVGNQATHAGVAAAEVRAFGVSHCEASGLLAEAWNFPQTLAAAMRYHHDPTGPQDEWLRPYAVVADLAGQCADVFANGRPALSIAGARAACMERLGMSPIACDALLVDVARQTTELAPLFSIPMEGQPSYQVLLAEAGDELSACAGEPAA